MKKGLKASPSIFLFLLAVSCFFINPVWGQEGQIHFERSFFVDWVRGEMNAQISFNLAQAGIRLPAGRILGEEQLRNAYPRILRPFLFSIRVDSNSTIRDLVDRGELSLEELNALCEGAERISTNLSSDLTQMTGRYRIPIEELSSYLIRHSRVSEPLRPLLPVQTIDYTGIIIIADEEIPVHGRMARAFLEPCLFPRIWDTNMNLIYERNMFAPGRNGGGLIVRYTTRENIFRPTPSGLDGELTAIVGTNPLRIIAREAFGVHPTDPVIDREDALRILSSENNRRLLREGRVILVLNAAQLTSTMP
jgi:hypothetical protein